MNRPPEEFGRISADPLRAFGAQCLERAGMLTDHAEQLARLLVDSDLRGVRSHGTRTLPGYCRSIGNGSVNPRPEFRVLKETDVAIHIDGDGSLGYAPMMMATDAAIAKARAKGVGIGAACNIGHYGSAGHFVRRAMAAGCTAFSVQGAFPQYYRDNQDKRAAHYGNPPICFGLPSESEPPVVMDAATCILADYQRGEDFEALEEMIPAALFKSMGYTAVGTLLGGAFVGMAGQRSREVESRWQGARNGGLIWVMDIGLFAPAGEFRQGVDEMVRLAREELIPLRGYDEATLPGAVEDRFEAEYSRDGIKLATDHIQSLVELGRELGVAVPWSE
jgi:LDH2 family malate/lactate/ureidoglycolate dehydrogenase